MIQSTKQKAFNKTTPTPTQQCGGDIAVIMHVLSGPNIFILKIIMHLVEL
jgi:hypothetical protein